MARRLEWPKIAPKAFQAMLGLEGCAKGNVEPKLYEMVKLRASYLNGCAFCIDMHAHDALELGENTRRLFVLAAWQEAPDLFTPAERAALALTDAVTRVGERGVPDDVWREAVEHHGEKGVADLLVAIVTINAWNRFAIATHTPLPDRA